MPVKGRAALPSRHGAETDAVGQVLTLLVAGAILLASIMGILLVARQSSTYDPATRSPSTDAEARSLASVLVDSQGFGWASGNDGLKRLGLRDANGGLHGSHMEALRGALFVSTANGKVDYPDARASLGLTGSQDFHIRVYPILHSSYEAAKSGMKALYIGDWTSLATVTVDLDSNDVMVTQANASLNTTMFGKIATERAALRQLGLDFNDRIFLTIGTPTILVSLPGPDLPLLTVMGVPLVEGDVLPDDKQYLSAAIPQRLEHCDAGVKYDEKDAHPCYDIVVIGSGVDHNTLTANPMKDAIRDWVLRGGMLVVLGSDSQNYQWLQPLFHVGVSTVNGSPTAPDISHPLLKVPNELAWPEYKTHGLGWDIKSLGSGAHYDDFSHVIVQGGEDALAVSKDGGFGAGRIVLTSFRPAEIAQELGQAETNHFFENIALYADRSHLFLEYGPTAPPNTAVSVAVRESWIVDDMLGRVPARIEIHLWGVPAK